MQFRIQILARSAQEVGKVNPGATTSWLSVRLWLPAILSTTAGAVDVIGLLALGGLFAAHITGDLVIVAAHYTTGKFGHVGPILAVPVFVVVLGVIVLLFGGIESKDRSRRSLLVVHAALLSICLGFGLGFGPFNNSDSPMAVLVGMLAVAAMATQNALAKLALVKAPSTAVMTTNTTQLIIDLATLARGGEVSDDLAKVRQRARVTFLCVAGFVAGCVAGAMLELQFGIGALALPVMLAVLAVALGEQRGRTYEQF
jgi:uncharacterized membrane protein YoaK (UPF0700 family)